MEYNKELQSRIDEVAEVAGYLWEKGWAERNGGNISYNVTDAVDESVKCLQPISEKFMLEIPVRNLAECYFLVTGNTKHFPEHKRIMTARRFIDLIEQDMN